MPDRPAPAPSSAVPATRNQRVHWAVQMNRRNRSLAFATLAIIIGWQQYPAQPHALFWVCLAASLLLYPQLAGHRAGCAQQPLQAEINNLRFDSLMLGAWTGYLGLPAWIGFAMFSSTLLNLMLFRGLPGLALSTALFALGTATSYLLFDPGWHPDTRLSVTLLCQAGLLLYLLSVSHEAYKRSVKLSLARRALRDSGASLQQQLSEIKALQSLLREQANRDALTGLYNRRYLDSTIERELARCVRESLPLSVMLVDADHFKRVNDEHGHQVGDAVLRRLGKTLGLEARASDVVCRYGGEEFLLLLPGMNSTNAQLRAEHLRLAFAQGSTATESGDVQVTLSVGIACYPEHGQTARDLLRHADQALYLAKDKGRNRVELYQAAATPPSAADAA